MKSILLYGSECWRVVKGDMAKIDAFHNGCLRKICRIFWPNKISNVDLYKKTGCNSAVLEIKRRRLRWLRHVLRMPGHSIPKVALRWTPPGKGKRGRPQMTWRQIVMAELRGYRGVRLRPQSRTESCGERLLCPYVPQGTMRKSKVTLYSHR